MAFDPKEYEDLSEEERQEKYDMILKEWEAFLKAEEVYAIIGEDFYIHKR